MTTAKVRIEGEDATAAAWSSAISRAKSASEQMAGIFTASLAGLSVGGLLEGAKSAFDYGASIERASESTRISARAMQELGYAAKELAGADLPTVTTAITFMEKALSEAGSGIGEQKKALDALGLSFKELQSLSPDRQFELIGERIHELKDPTDAARASADLLGRSWQEIGPIFSQGAAGIEKLRAEADKLGIALSDEQIKRLDDASKTVDQLKTGLARLFDALVAKYGPAMTDFATMLTGKLSGDQQMTDAARARLAGLAPQSYPNQRFGVIDRSGELGEVSVSAQRLGGGPPGFQHGEDALQPVEVTASKLQVDALQKLFAEFGADTRTELERQTDAFLKKIDELGELSQRGDISRGLYLSRTGSALDALPIGEQTNQIEDLLSSHALSMQEGGQLLSGQLEKQMTSQAEMPDLGDSLKVGTDKMQAIAEQAGRNMQNAFSKFLFDPFKGGVRGMAESFLQAMQKMLANEASEKLFQALGSWGSGNSGAGGVVGGIASLVGGMFGGGKAGGGDVSGGRSYLVGEVGPEIFTPSAHGVITPNSAIGQNVTIDMSGDTHIHTNGSNASEMARVLPGILAAHAARTKADMLNAFRRSGLPAPYRA